MDPLSSSPLVSAELSEGEASFVHQCINDRSPFILFVVSNVQLSQSDQVKQIGSRPEAVIPCPLPDAVIEWVWLLGTCQFFIPAPFQLENDRPWLSRFSVEEVAF
jgi:hypothetical protein